MQYWDRYFLLAQKSSFLHHWPEQSLEPSQVWIGQAQLQSGHHSIPANITKHHNILIINHYSPNTPYIINISNKWRRYDALRDLYVFFNFAKNLQGKFASKFVKLVFKKFKLLIFLPTSVIYTHITNQHISPVGHVLEGRTKQRSHNIEWVVSSKSSNRCFSKCLRSSKKQWRVN